MSWPKRQARRSPATVAAAMARACGRRCARRRTNRANHAAIAVPPPGVPVMPMLQTTLGASAAVAVHGKRGTSSSAQGANNPTA